MVGLEDSIKPLLRPSDEIKFILECVLLPPSASNDNTAPDASGIKNYSTLRHQRIVAIITHKEGGDNWEEGSVFVLKRKLFSSSSSMSNELEIHRVFPVYGDFTMTMAQLPQDSNDTQTFKLPRTRFKLTINPGQTLIGNEPVDLATDDVSALKDVLTECRRLKELSEVNSPTQTYSWLASYANNNNNIFIPSPFPDLRNSVQPLYSRLSPASPGTTGDDLNDIVLIRDEWARSRARNQCRRGRVRLNIRLGTFNVNGKMPTQDLAAWVRGSTKNAPNVASIQHSLLPPVSEISPLSLGEVVKDPYDLREAEGASPSLVSSESPAIYESVPVPLVQPEVPTVSFGKTSESIAPKPDPDILVFGFEELDLSTEALLYSTSTAREDAWTVAIFAALGEKAQMYEKLASKQLVGMLIIIIVQKSLKACFSHVMTSSVGAGIMGLMGNKGGTAIRLAFTPPASSLEDLDSALGETASTDEHHHGIEHPGPTILTFVVSHLAAFDDMVSKRNADFHELSKRLIFDSSNLALTSDNSQRNSVGSASSQSIQDTNSSMLGGMAPSQNLVSVPEKFGVFESDILFWMGDLNYRINLPDADVRALLSSESWKNKLEILKHFDQLKTSIREKKAFEIFLEYDIHHLPTYRFGGGISTDSLGYDTKRKPAWTDRILYAFSPLTAKLEPSSYTGHGEITMSDHRPISADFSVDVDLFDKNQLHATAANLFRQVQGMEERAKAKLSQTSIDMGDILCAQIQILTYLRLTGNLVRCTHEKFLTNTNFLFPVPPWLSASHTTGLLLPNEHTEITLLAFIDNKIASRFNLGPRDLNCTLIIHTLMGKDHFISIKAEYQYTCFANKLSRLTHLPGPIRAMKSHNDLLGEGKAINAPREIVRLVNWLMSCAHPTEDLFMVEADPDIVDDIREHLDTGNEFPYSHDTRERSIPIAFGAALMELLESLPEYIIPKELHGRCVAVEDRDEAFEVLDEFPPESVNVWISVTAFLHYIVQNSSSRAEEIGMYFHRSSSVGTLMVFLQRLHSHPSSLVFFATTCYLRQMTRRIFALLWVIRSLLCISFTKSTIRPH
ncbi:DNase I-like protein [Lentinula detonsa]|uniref:DNase I-like protein n=1 Tax=Lentinula detonsa TaxID=2804962 RepID=A0A9W8NVD0_9AGAR|nr:DNase I-like protein [Lentinula detonsa]